jgi:hypothetical protein
MFRTSEDYEHFSDYIRMQSQYVLDGWLYDFMDTVVETGKKRITMLRPDQTSDDAHGDT